MTEGTFGATPLLACQLVSGDILYVVTVCTRIFLFMIELKCQPAAKKTYRICHYRFIMSFKLPSDCRNIKKKERFDSEVMLCRS